MQISMNHCTDPNMLNQNKSHFKFLVPYHAAALYLCSFLLAGQILCSIQVFNEFQLVYRWLSRNWFIIKRGAQFHPFKVLIVNIFSLSERQVRFADPYIVDIREKHKNIKSCLGGLCFSHLKIIFVDVNKSGVKSHNYSFWSEKTCINVFLQSSGIFTCVIILELLDSL